MTIETITDLIHEYLYDRLNDSNNSNDGSDIKTYKIGHRKENGQKNPFTKEIKEDRATTKKDTKTTVADNAEHRTGLHNTNVAQNLWSAEIARREDTTKRFVASPNKYNMWREQHHQQKKITGITTKFKRQITTERKGTTFT